MFHLFVTVALKSDSEDSDCTLQQLTDKRKYTRCRYIHIHWLSHIIVKSVNKRKFNFFP